MEQYCLTFYVTQLFTFPTTKKNKLLRQLVDAENERHRQVVFTFVDSNINLKTDGPDGIERGGKKMKKLFCAITILAFFTTACATKTITVSCPSSGATIEIDGKYAGSQQASARFSSFADVVVSAPNYITQSFRLDKDSRNVTNVCLNPRQEEKKDDYWLASVPASDIANKTLRFRATSDKSDDEIWYTLIRYASDYFGDFTVNDKGAGWAKSTWVTRSFDKVKVRSRMELKRNPGDKKEFTLFLSSQITPYMHCNDDDCYQPWDRVLKTYVELPSALSTGVQ